MNKNAEVHFMQLPQVDIGRSVFDLSKDHMMSGDCGYVYPIFWEYAMPGDTWKVKLSQVIRFQTMLTPTFGNISADIHAYAVPLRLLWSHFKEFTGENTASAWIPSTSYTVPTISAPASTGFAVGGVADHLGLPVGVTWNATDLNAPSALPFRCYGLICTSYYRDENLTDPLNVPTGDSNQTGTNGSSYINDVCNGGACFKAAKYHDMWTSMLPQAQKANPVSIGLVQSGLAPVNTGVAHSVNTTYPVELTLANGNYIGDGTHRLEASGASGTSYLNAVTSSETVQSNTLNISNLWADLTSATGNVITINELRLAFQLQKYYEKLARGGSLYTEQIRQMFGIISPDARVQRPEYLGGYRVPIQVHQVANTAQTNSDFLGDVGALSVTSDQGYLFEKSFTEDCIVMIMLTVRYEHSYCQGIEPKWLKKDWLQFYKPVFANIGEQPYRKVSLYASGNMNSDSVFGYNEAWCEYRVLNNSVAGEMRPGVTNSLASWHLADYYQSSPTLSDAWIREDATNVDRVLAVQSTSANQFFGDFWFDIKATRCMPVYSIPGLIDHH